MKLLLLDCQLENHLTKFFFYMNIHASSRLACEDLSFAFTLAGSSAKIANLAVAFISFSEIFHRIFYLDHI